MRILTDVLHEEVHYYRRKWKARRLKLAKSTQKEQQATLDELDKQFLICTDGLLKDLDNLALTLSVVGTTSGGKSTLVNFLCGAEIIPSSVQEMSNGLVSVKHSELKSIYIKTTNNALWDCGHWKNVTEEDIRVRLNQVMNAYLQAKQNGRFEVESPIVIVNYPLWIQTKVLQLPQEIKLEITDLPGLSSADNIDNLELLRRSNSALYIVNFNCAETDRQKTRRLMQEIIGKLGGGYKQLLFVFNRIDVFRADQNWCDSERNFINKTIGDFQKQADIQSNPKNAALSARRSQVLRISALPALLACLVKNDSEKYKDASAILYRRFSFLLSENTLQNLPRNHKTWTRLHHNQVVQDIFIASYANNFQDQFQSFIYSNLSYFLISQKVGTFRVELKKKLYQNTYKIQNQQSIRYSSISEITLDTERLFERMESVLDSVLRDVVGCSSVKSKILIWQWYVLRFFGLARWAFLTKVSNRKS